MSELHEICRISGHQRVVGIVQYRDDVIIAMEDGVIYRLVYDGLDYDVDPLILNEVAHREGVELL